MSASDGCENSAYNRGHNHMSSSFPPEIWDALPVENKRWILQQKDLSKKAVHEDELKQSQPSKGSPSEGSSEDDTIQDEERLEEEDDKPMSIYRPPPRKKKS